MGFTRRFKLMSCGIFMLTSAYALLGLARGLGGLFGVTQFPILEGVQFSLAAMILIGTTLLLGAIALIFISGYVALTGWRGASAMPLLLKVTATFMLGLFIFAVAAVVGAYIPIPILPIVIVTAVFWLIFRKLSEASQLGGAAAGVPVAQAEAIALQALQARLPNVTLTATGAQTDAGKWELIFKGSDGNAYQATVDPRTGNIRSWGPANR
jgi:hypothetical protein